MSMAVSFVTPVSRSAVRVRVERRNLAKPTATAKQTRCAVVRAEKDVAQLSDERLLGRYRDLRRAEDFAELVRRYSGALGRYLHRYLGDAALAEDVLQDTFLLVHAKCGHYRDGGSARSWLYSVATHRAVDALRRLRRMPSVRLDQPICNDGSVESATLLDLLSSPGVSPLDDLQQRERHQWVRENVAELPEPLRHVLVLAYDQELPYAEIAALLDIPLGTVKSRLHSALARLREKAERSAYTGSR
jgi:RNA polymerase sigma-70 factor, ECF subfamily